MAEQSAHQSNGTPTDTVRTAMDSDPATGSAWTAWPSVMPGPPVPDPPTKVLAAAAAGGAVSALVGAFFLRRWLCRRGWIS